MKTKNVLLAMFDDDHHFLHAIKALRSEGIRIDDAYMPFPVHGFEEALGMKESKLHVGGFWIGLCGCLFALGFIYYVTNISWPTNWGGKPDFSILAWVPITFEVTVLSAAVSMFFAFIMRNAMYPGKKPVIMDERLTDDLFAITFDLAKLDGKDLEDIKQVLNNNHVVEIRESVTEDTELLALR